jgi:glycosyltransferase involved in cell wall biosynthesis
VKWISGLRSAEEVAPLYAEYDLLLLPTRLDQFGLVLGEAAGAGVPMVATDVGGIRAMVRNGETGTLLPFGAGAEDLAVAVERFVLDENYHAQCAEGAFQMARNELSMDRFDALMRRVVERLLA